MLHSRRVVLLAALPCVLTTASLQAAPLHGQIILPADYPGRVLDRAAGFWLLPNDVLDPLPPLVDRRAEMVVTLEGSGIIGASLVKPVMRLEDSRFMPPMLPVAPHTKVTFENRDPIVHKLESAGLQSIAKQDLAPKGVITHVYDTPGSYGLRCTEFPHMHGVVFVVGAPLFVQPDASGAFLFPEVRPGTYTLSVWYREQWIHRQQVVMKAGRTSVEVRLQSLLSKGKD